MEWLGHLLSFVVVGTLVAMFVWVVRHRPACPTCGSASDPHISTGELTTDIRRGRYRCAQGHEFVRVPFDG
ncbi:hypothetical protein HY632_00390 [Candidatus Uhrbacteria bacterium]|nr:hypothetical protein [Candidatus Uhrbacteria bacterium]